MYEGFYAFLDYCDLLVVDGCFLFLNCSDAHSTLDVGMGVVALKLEVVEVETENVFLVWIEVHGGEWPWLAGELELALGDVVVVDVGIAKGVDEVAILQAAGLCNHHGEEGVGGNVERNAKEDVGGALVELAAEAAVGYIELKEDVARREVHGLELANIPCRDEETTGVGVVLNLADEIADLVDMATIGTTPRTPLMAIDRAELAVGASPFVPDGDIVVV